jgi:hypothetical protein
MRSVLARTGTDTRRTSKEEEFEQELRELRRTNPLANLICSFHPWIRPIDPFLKQTPANKVGLQNGP